MSAPIQLSVHCNKCGQGLVIEYTTNPFFSEDFVRKMALCNPCADRRKRRAVRKPIDARVPHND